MDRPRRLAIAFGIGAIVLLGLFPPWTYVSAFPAGDPRARTYAQEVPGGMGHHFILDPPSTTLETLSVDLAGLGMVWSLVAGGVAIAVVSARKRGPALAA